MLRVALVCLLVAPLQAGFISSIFSGKSSPVTTGPVSQIRGVPDGLNAKYIAESFICDNGVKLDAAQVNDNYCDCEDGSDEPGTSACHNGRFVCVNQGYKPLHLTSSRVDDGICDCCDGSDEAVGKCTNVCDVVAAGERAALKKMMEDYTSGSRTRDEYLSQINKKRADANIQLESLTSELHSVQNELDVAKESLQQAEKEQKTQQEAMLKKTLTTVAALLDINSYSLDNVVELLLTLFSLHDIIEEDIPELLQTTPLSSHDENIDHIHDEYDEYADVVTAEVAQDGSITPEACPVAALNADERLKLLCHSPLDEFVSRFVIFKKAHKQIQGLLSYYHTYATFVGAKDFYIRSSDATACPTDLNPASPLCTLAATLEQTVSEYDTYANPAVESLKSRVSELQSRLSSLQADQRRAQSLLNDLSAHSDFAAFVAVKDECFKVVDGKFTYTLCVMSNIKQSEDGHGDVLLGNFDKFEQLENGDVKMLFTRGQHCHAFGARSAAVTVTCGATNVLMEAREPTTCSYTFKFESPAACSKEYATHNGLSEK